MSARRIRRTQADDLLRPHGLFSLANGSRDARRPSGPLALCVSQTRSRPNIEHLRRSNHLSGTLNAAALTAAQGIGLAALGMIIAAALAMDAGAEDTRAPRLEARYVRRAI